MIILILVYIAGLLLSFSMLRVEIESDKEPYTKGARVLTAALSLLSWVMVLISLVAAWIAKIKLTGYWDRPVKPIDQPEKPAAK